MTINQETLKSALAGAYDPEAEYLVCGYNDVHLMHSKGYEQVGVIQDPSPENRVLLIFKKPKVAAEPEKKRSTR